MAYYFMVPKTYEERLLLCCIRKPENAFKSFMFAR